MNKIFEPNNKDILNNIYSCDFCTIHCIDESEYLFFTPCFKHKYIGLELINDTLNRFAFCTDAEAIAKIFKISLKEAHEKLSAINAIKKGYITKNNE